MFVILLISIVSASDHTKCVSLSNQNAWLNLLVINLLPNEYSQQVRYYLFSVNLDRCAGSYNTLFDLSIRVCVPNETEDLNLHVFITRINKLKTLIKHILCKCKCKLIVKNVTWIKSGIMISVGLSVKIQMNILCARKIYLESCNM